MLPRVIRIQTRDSSVGRAGDCSVQSSELSLGHWFKSGSRDLFLQNNFPHILYSFITLFPSQVT